MNEYKVSDYGVFSDAVASTTTFSTSVSTVQESVTTCREKISDETIFMGPIQQNCVQVFSTLDTDFSDISSKMSQISGLLTNTSASYQAGDQNADAAVTGIGDVGGLGSADGTAAPLGTSGAGATTTTAMRQTGTPKSSVTIPDSVKQGGYTVTCYGEGGWYLSGKATPTRVAPGTNQKSVHEKWLANGARYKNGIAVMNVNGQDHYLIATANTLGNVGDNVNVKFANGQSIPCVIADQKNPSDSNYTTYGHAGNGTVHVLEFEVDRNVYNKIGNPTTSSWGLEWDSSSRVSSVDNYGSVI